MREKMAMHARRSLHVPELANSHFSTGGIAWDMLKSAAILRQNGGAVDLIDLSDVRHMRPYGVAIVAAMAELSSLHGNPVTYLSPRDDQIRDHLARLGLPAIVGQHDPAMVAPRTTNLPIRIQKTRSDTTGSEIAEMLVRELGYDLPGGLEYQIAENIDEMVLNALTHAESEVGCVIVGQAFPQTSVLEVAILDLGITIPTHLGRAVPGLPDDATAIVKAIEDGVTGTKDRNRFGEPNSGAGLYNLTAHLEATGGEMAILSGSAVVWMNSLGKWGRHELHGPRFEGTLVNIVFSTRPGSTGVGPAPQADL
jgi:hypothetical protein